MLFTLSTLFDSITSEISIVKHKKLKKKETFTDKKDKKMYTHYHRNYIKYIFM